MKRLFLSTLVVVVACNDDSNPRTLPDAPGAPMTEISSETRTFDDGECGGQPAATSITFANTGTGPLAWSATIEGGGFAIAGDTSGTVEATGSGTITVQPDAISASATVGHVIEATLVVQTNARAEAFAVPLSLQVHGGSLLVETPSIAFGQIQVSVPAAATPISIRNGGDRPIQVALGPTSTQEFSATWTGAPSAITLEPGAALDGATSGFVPAGEGARTDSVAVVATGPLCAGDAATVALAGEGTFAQIGVTPGAIAFGTTPCGSTATTRNVTIANNYAIAITYTAAVMTGPYSIAPANQSGTIAASSSVVIPVVANVVPRAPTSLGANVLDGSVRITTNAPGHTPATIALDQAASGAVLALAPAPGSTIAFGDVVAGAPESESYTVSNSGNLTAQVTVSATGSGFSAAAPGTGTIPTTGVAQTGSITQTVPARGPLEGRFTLSSSTNRCQAAGSDTLELTATGRAPVLQVGRIDSMSVQCGGGPSPIVTISVRNMGDAPLILSSAEISAGFILVSTIPMTIAAGATASLQVRASQAIIGVDRGGTTRTGTLTVRTNEIGTPERTLDLVADVNGANIDLEYPISTVIQTMQFTTTMACPADRIIGIRNSGNQPVSLFEWSTPPATHFRFATPIPSPTLDPGELTTTRIEVVILDQQCSITTPEQLRFRTMGTNICTTRNANSEVVLPLTYRINGFSTCTCN
jgi:hypothetical protein